MKLQCLKTIFITNKTVLLISIVMVSFEIISILEANILENIALVSKKADRYSKMHPGNYTCPFVANRKLDHQTQQTSFYWSELQKTSIIILRSCCPAFTLLFAGIYSDKYGGHRVLLVGLLTCAVVMSTMYLSILHNNYIFLVMLALGRSSQGIMWTAFFSLGGKLTEPGKRSVYVGIILSAESFGRFLADIVSRLVHTWKTISQISGFVAFVTAIWWWIICRGNSFPVVRRTKIIPYKDIVTSVSFYGMCLLCVSCYVSNSLPKRDIRSYMKEVLVLNIDSEWIISLLISLTEMSACLFCGVSSDYIISTIHISASAVRRSYFSLTVIVQFCIVIVIRLAGCEKLWVMGCWIGLYYAQYIAWSTTMAAVLDIGSSISGTVVGLMFTIGLLPKIPIHMILDDIFISGDSKGDISRWSYLFFTTICFSFAFSLPFICYGLKEITNIESVDSRYALTVNRQLLANQTPSHQSVKSKDMQP